MPKWSDKKTAEKKAAMLKAMDANIGIVTPSAEAVGIHLDTHRKWLAEDAEYRRKAEDMLYRQRDFVNSKMFEGIAQGNPTLIIFWQKCKGGYTEQRPAPTETDDDKNVTITVKYE